MADTNIKYILINFITLGILIFGIMSFIITIQSDSNLAVGNRITNNTYINDSYGNLETSLDKQSSAENSLNSLNEVPPQEEVGDLSIASIVSTTWSSRSIITGLWNIYVKLPMVILGVSPAVASAISTILLILIAIGLWAVWKGVTT